MLGPAAASRPAAQIPVLVPVSAREFVSAFRVSESEPVFTEAACDAPEFPTDDAEPALVAVAIAEADGQPDDASPTHPAFIEEPGENLDIPAFLRKGTL
jgi:hypothetical protein